MSPEPPTLEESTFDSVNKVIAMYGKTNDDVSKIYHLSSAISLLTALKLFLEAKKELRNTTDDTVKLSDKDSKNHNVEINVNVTKNHSRQSSPDK